ncbi:hypothetical protein [Oleiharenicola lentus]|uniref:hypothetical protein n=1 Tax=Oleiharenicola lentus TaxID=2508720 RepID=UPI003F66DC16
MPLSRCFSAGARALIFSFLCVFAFAKPIDREAVVARHAVKVTSVDPESPLSVGNGDFAFTVDVTGLQTFEKRYHAEGIPLETLSTWAWHEFPNVDNLTLDDASTTYNFHGRPVKFAGKQNSPAGKYFRENPHPIALGQISLWYQGKLVTEADLAAIDQQLDLWTGVVRSTYMLAGQPVTVETAAHATRSTVGVRIESPLVASGALEVRFRFPYSYKFSTRNKPPFQWEKADAHRTTIARSGKNFAELARSLDTSGYFARVEWAGAGQLSEVAPHTFRLAANGEKALAFTCDFTPKASDDKNALTFADVKKSSERGWRDYWTKGGIVDFAGSTDPRANELERRTILSLYLVKVNYAGDMPPGEDGLTNITWFGKHHSEMYYWHTSHFYQWGRVELLEKSFAWYKKILPVGKMEAKAQGFDGVRWPKMSGIDGRTGPGSINPFIIWNQPNPIALSELIYRAKPNRETLDNYREVVEESAKFLASFAALDPKTNRYVLGPPIKNVSEKSGQNETQNPTFELAYWYYGLQVAQTWRERLGLKREPLWDDILKRLTPLPQKDGLYLEIETFPDMYAKEGGVPTSMLMILGFMPKIDIVDTEVVRRTFAEVNRRNGADRWASWATGQAAMTAAHLGETEHAVSILTNPNKVSRFMNNGHVRRPKEPEDCPAYLPVNVSLLSAVALMAGGWDGAPAGNAPGFPKEGWVVRSEGLAKLP